MLPTPFEQFQADVESGKPTFLLITSVNCKPCERVKPLFEATADAFSKGHFHQINASDLPPEFLRERMVRTAPTMLFFAFGVEEHRIGVEKDFLGVGIAVGNFITKYHEEQLNSNTTRPIEG